MTTQNQRVIKNMKQIRSKTNYYYRLLVSSALITGGLFQLALPVFAAGTAAGTTINNTATATYEDPSTPGTPINATSNTVNVTVASVAAITNIGSTITDSTPATGALPGDTLTYQFLITNNSNFAVPIQIPAPVPTGPLTVGTVTYDIDADGDGTFETSATTTAPAGNISPGGQIRVNVPTTVNTLATSGSPLEVRLGDTGPNDNSAATQNQVINGTLNVQTDGGATPVNGDREASAVLSIPVASSIQKKAFSAVLKTSTITDPSNTPATLNDDIITYNLSLRVDASAPAGATGYTVEDLAPGPILIDGNPLSRILVSDVIPAGTELAALPVAPTGWTLIYSADNTSNVDAVTDWSSATPGNPAAIAAVKRVGFVKNSNQAKGTTVTGFTFQVRTTGIDPTNGGQVYNIAQLLGTTNGLTNTDPNYTVYDESGDQNPSNFTDTGTVGDQTPNTGVADAPTQGVDPNNNNSGSDDPAAADNTKGGEDNVVNVVAPGSVLNGPSGNPSALGPTGNNDDFTNKAATDLPATVPASGVIAGYDPAVKSFTNTIGNPSTATTLTDVLLRPYVSSTTTTDPGYSNVPVGTTVTITYGAISATYTYQGGAVNNFVLTSGSPVIVSTIAPGAQVNYTVDVDLPTGVSINTGYSVPISAFVDGNSDSIPNATEVQNRTIDRVWVGYLQLVKEVQILENDNTTVVKTWTSTPDAAFNAEVRPGRFLQYRVTYKNLTETAGVGSVPLNAQKIVITEDGTLSTVSGDGKNNWGKDNDVNGVIDTSNVVSSASDSLSGVVTFFNGDPAASSTVDQKGTTVSSDVTKYVNTLPSTFQLPPQQSGVFTFKRQIN
jgi:hypothetical protein